MARLHLIKLSVGTESVADLARWQAHRAVLTGGPPVHVTRMWPRRGDEIIGSGGSIYWVIKGVVLARQPISGFEKRIGEDGIERCAIVLAPELVRTAPQPRRPFQGWRYLRPEDAPKDLEDIGETDLPPALAAELAAIGVV